MISHDLPKQAHDFIERLAATEPPPESIWLIGSRANGRATAASDTDLLVFGSMDLIRALADAGDAPSGIDCLVVFDGNRYKDPFQDQSGSLHELEWRTIDPDLSRYVGIKWVPDPESDDESLGLMKHLQERAVRIWPARA